MRISLGQGTTAAILLTSGLLSACNGDQTVPQANADALRAITSQQLNWTGCDPTLLAGYDDLVKDVRSRLQCADVTVPLDWNAPSRGTASFALLRIQAATPDARKGAIFFNPGGPGGDGLLFGAVYGALWAEADPSTSVGKAVSDLQQTYDLVGFSPRGVGQSSQANCATSELGSPEHYQSSDRSQKNIDAMLRNAALVAKACKKSPFSAYINTDQTARDLDLARQLMGDATFNYVGYSYGTWLGSWYAKLFPATTGRMLLDGNTAFDRNFDDSFNLQPLGFERAFRDVALYYAARHNDVYALGTTKEAVYAVYDAFQPDLKLALQYTGLINSLYTDSGITDVSVQLVAARGVSTLIRQHPEITDASDLEALFDDYAFSANKELDAVARSIAYGQASLYFSIVHEEVGSVSLSDSSSVFTNVVCNDTPSNSSQQYWIDFGNREAQTHPLIGGSYTEQPCLFWGQPTATKPPVPSTMPPVLMLQNEDDPATPREGAIAAWKSLPNASLLFVDNEAMHTAFPYGTECVDLNVANYFLSGTLPKDKFTVCQALALPGEDAVYPVGDTYQTGVTPQGLGHSGQAVAAAQRVNAFGSSVQAQRAVAAVKAIIQRNALRPRR